MHIIYSTTSSKEEALKISRILVAEKIVACTNIIENMTSVYLWQENIEESSESILIAKTSEECVSATISRIKELHSYEIPCVFSIKTEESSKDFLKWVEDSTRP